ncbi:MAG: hypothetical protein ACREDT_10405 [Methylocella sp.]
MIVLSQETEALAKQLAAAQSLSVDEAVRQGLEEKARAAGVVPEAHRPRRQRMTVEKMLAAGAEIAAMPLLDQRSAREIMDDLNAL